MKNVEDYCPDDKTDWRKWLELNHNKKEAVWLIFYKQKSPNYNLSWSDSVDEALCFGWIDGVRKSIDNESYCIRFTPRKSTSIWSAVNINKMEVLIESELMQPSGFKSYKLRKESKSKVYAYEKKVVVLSSNYEKVFKSNKIAWDFFSSQAPSYQKKIIHLIMSAKQEKTQVSRLEKAIKESELLKRVY
jgi:uncharacterized protein YdeI (YjbR/CyaY-like superfamily)